jgi:hypothetical protein
VSEHSLYSIRFVYATKMAATVTIRVTPETRDRLNRISAARGISTGELVDELASEAEEGALLESMARHYAELRSDEEAWELHRAEVVAWDATVGDGTSATE